MSFVDRQATVSAHGMRSGFNPLRHANVSSGHADASSVPPLEDIARRFGHRVVAAAAVTVIHVALAKYVFAALNLVHLAAAKISFTV
jgi:hypothetical protein